MRANILRQAMRSAGFGALMAGGMAAMDPALAGGCNSCDPGCSTCQTCTSGSSNDASRRTDIKIGVEIIPE